MSRGTSERDADDTPSRARISELEARLVVVQAEADKWQAIAAERGLALEDLRRSLRVIEARNVENRVQDVARGPETVERAPEVPTHPVEPERPRVGRLARLWGR